MKLCIFVASFEFCDPYVIHFCSVVMYFVVMICCYFGPVTNGCVMMITLVSDKNVLC